MNISSLEEYALRCALQLARLPEGEYLSASRIAEREGLSAEYAGKIMFLFRQAKLVKSVRGISGGFRLRKTPHEISLREVFDALPISKRIDDDFCKQYGGQNGSCVHLGGCSVRPFWLALSAFFQDFTGSVTLADLLMTEAEVQRKLQHLSGRQGSVKQAL